MNPIRDGWAPEDIEIIMRRGDPAELLHVPVAVTLDPPDCAWAEEICLSLASHENPHVRGNAILGLGHLARTCRALALPSARAIVAAGLADPNEFVRGQAAAAAEDIQAYLGIAASGPESAGQT